MFKNISCIIVFLLISSIIIQNGAAFSDSGDERVSILFLGDFYFGESYQTSSLHNRGINIIEEHGYDYMFENVKDLLMSSTATITNLETTLAGKENLPVSIRKPYIHWSDASETVKYLKKYNVSVFSLANNHTFDYGIKGLKTTIEEISNNGLQYFGAGMNSTEAEAPFVKPILIAGDTTHIAVLSGFEYRISYDSIYNYYAGDNKPGVNLLSAERICNQVTEIRSKFKNVFIIVFPHWGSNYEFKNQKQTETARKLIDCGVDLILGHGSHMFQDIEKFNGKWIVYSIGNSIFNTPGRYNSHGVRPYSFITDLSIKDSGGEVKMYLRLYPIYTDNLSADYQIRFLDSDEFIDCYNNLKQKGSDVDKFGIKENYYSKNFEIGIK